MTKFSDSPRLGLAYLQERQAMKHVTVNEALKRLDVLVQGVCVSRSLSVQPSSPEEGSVFILPGTRSGGNWSTMEADALACYVDGAWFEILPAIGWSVYVMDEGLQVFFTGEGWTGAGVDSPRIRSDQLGVNTIADTTNRLSVKSDAVLFSHDDQTPGSGDIRLTLNKANTAASASLIFSKDYEGCFEIGLGGSSDLAVRRSTDGTNYADCVGVSKTTGDLTLANSAGLSFKTSLFPTAPPFRMVAEGDSWMFRKKTSDTQLSEGTRFVFDGAGGQTLGNPFWQGVQYACTLVREGGVSRFPRFSFYWSYTDKDDPDDLTFNIVPGNSGYLKTALKLRTVNGGDIVLDGGRILVGSASQSGEASLCVDGAIKPKAYTLSTLPLADGQGAGAIIYVSDASGGGVPAFSDGTSWRRMTDRSLLN